MMTNPELVQQFEMEYLRNEELSVEQRFALLEGMYQMAVNAGHFRPEQILDGIENDIALARALSSNVRIPPR
jgi:hypothetical protein